jgi:hypothetical protein
MSVKQINNGAYAKVGYTFTTPTTVVDIGSAAAVGGAKGARPAGTGGAGVLLQSGLAGAHALSNDGAITGGQGGYDLAKTKDERAGAGGAGIFWGSLGTVTNAGTVTGGKGGSAGPVSFDLNPYSGVGGVGINLAHGGAVNNSGKIVGGAGGYGYDNGGTGGAGVLASGASTINNSGTVVGGDGANSYFQENGGNAGDGASGVVLAGSGLVVNSGSIAGGSGGTALYQTGGLGGAGVVVAATGTVLNRGLINGGVGGSQDNIMFGGPTENSGAGIVLQGAARVVNGRAGKIVGGGGYYTGDGIDARGAGATITNFGTIVGFGPISGYYGGSSPGLAVHLYAATDRFIAEAHSVVSGQIAGGGATLELAGGRGTLAGIGGASATTSGAEAMSFYGFGAYVIDAGGVWSLTGSNTLAAGKSLTGSKDVTLSGSLTVASGGTVTDVAPLAGAALIVNGSATFDETSRLLGALTGSGVVFERGAGTLVQSGDAAGFSGKAVISGGTLKLANATGFGTAEIQYDVASSTLELVASAAPAAGHTFAETLFNFDKTGESLDLAGKAYVSGATAVLTGHDLKLVDGAYTADFTVSGSSASSYAKSFTVTSDGHGGTLIEAIGAAARTFAQAMAATNGHDGPAGVTSLGSATLGASPLVAPDRRG